MLDLESFNCTGCTACYNICPTQAITMLVDKEGFKFPRIDNAQCINCSLCKKVCVPLNGYTQQTFEQKVYGAKNKDVEERKHSQSGGVFFVLAKYVLAQGGVVYGALIDDAFAVRHGRAITEEQAKLFRGSKYVQSDLGNIFKDIKKDLEAGLKVLFSGVPCQVAGLKSFLKKDYENLLLVDVICHGVPSPMVWSDYIQWQQARLKNNIEQVDFRDKDLPWGVHYEKLTLKNKRKKFQIYARLFHSHNILRKSCYNCLFATTERVSDITIGDYWGIENIKSEFKDDFGVSAVLINSKKGDCIWNKVAKDFDWFACDIQDVLPRNPNLAQATSMPNAREQFWKDYEQGFTMKSKKYGKYTIIYRIKLIIKRILKKS